jgi:hypothetical protein
VTGLLGQPLVPKASATGCRSMWEIQPTGTDAVVEAVFGDCCRGSLLPDCYTPRRVIDGLTPRDRQRGHARVSGQVSDGCGARHSLMDGALLLVGCAGNDDQFRSRANPLATLVGDPADDHQRSKCRPYNSRSTAGLCQTLAYHPRHGTTTLAFSEDGVYIRFVGYCNHVMRQVPVPQPSGPRRWCVSLVVVGGNRWLRQWVDMKLGDIMRRIIIRSLAVTAVFTGLLFTGAGVAGANAAPPLNAPCYVLPTSCP